MLQKIIFHWSSKPHIKKAAPDSRQIYDSWFMLLDDNPLFVIAHLIINS